MRGAGRGAGQRRDPWLVTGDRPYGKLTNKDKERREECRIRKARTRFTYDREREWKIRSTKFEIRNNIEIRRLEREG